MVMSLCINLYHNFGLFAAWNTLCEITQSKWPESVLCFLFNPWNGTDQFFNDACNKTINLAFFFFFWWILEALQCLITVVDLRKMTVWSGKARFTLTNNRDHLHFWLFETFMFFCALYQQMVKIWVSHNREL